MDAWAASYGSSVAFVCVSCAGPQLAGQFGNELKLKTCHNTWVDEDDMPTWGQLGCNGLIVIDGSDSVVCQASPAYLEVRDKAFRHVETLLDALLGAQPAPQLKPGRLDGDGCASVRFGADADGAEAEVEEDVTDTQAIKYPSVKVDVLDAEHAACEEKLSLLGRLTDPPGVNGKRGQIRWVLEELLKAYEAHFAHEEKLLDEHLYKGGTKRDSDGFSADQGARTSHFADHQAMLSAVRELLADVASVDAAAAVRLAADFERHATAYDGGYADRLSAAMAQAPPAAVAAQ